MTQVAVFQYVLILGNATVILELLFFTETQAC